MSHAGHARYGLYFKYSFICFDQQADLNREIAQVFCKDLGREPSRQKIIVSHDQIIITRHDCSY